MPPPPPPPPPPGDGPVEAGRIYAGKVSNVMDFGCFVQLDGVKGRAEGLVHVSLIQSAPLRTPADAVKRGQPCYVKVLSVTGSKMSLSMRDADQRSGADLNPQMRLPGQAGDLSPPPPRRRRRRRRRRPTRRATASEARSGGVLDVRLAAADDEPHRPVKRLTSPEKFEAQQLIASGVLDVRDYPQFDDEAGLMNVEKTEEELEIELNEQEPLFLRGQTKNSVAMSPIKVVKNPDGSLQRAAMTQSALAKERRELREQQQRALMDSIPKDLNRPWEDPMPEPGERHIAQELRGLRYTQEAVPEWKQQSMGKAVSFGFPTRNRSMAEQRESLPIFTLKNELVAAVSDNQFLVVIGETGSGKTTQMTQYMAEAGFTLRGIIGCTQPRRVAAMSVAKRVAEEFGCRLGQEVGYSIRFEDCTSPGDGDQVHDRRHAAARVPRRHQPLAVLAHHARRGARADDLHRRPLRPSQGAAGQAEGPQADLHVGHPRRREVLDLLLRVPDLHDPGAHLPRRGPVRQGARVRLPRRRAHHGDADPPLRAARRRPALPHGPGGDRHVAMRDPLRADEEASAANLPELPIILPVYSALPSEMQTRIFEPPPPGARKVVVATNIAEASLTIDGIYYVVDPGFVKQKAYNAKVGMDSLTVVPISQASARQRAGRAGRTGPGKCYRLYTEAAYRTRCCPRRRVPEIQRTNLGNTVLR